jgi:tetratricopeptide (TPR) repeat protein
MGADWRAIAIGSLLAAGSTACFGRNRGKEYVAAYAAGEAAFGAGHFSDAAARFDEAARGAKVPRDAAHARYLAARALASAGDVAGAAARLKAIADASPPLEDSPAAACAIAEMELARGDDAGWTDLFDVARRFPSSGVARPSLRRAIAHEDDKAGGGPATTLAFLAKITPAFDGTELAETVAYETALHLAAAGEGERAHDAFVAMATRWPYPHGLFWDDALFRASEIDERKGRLDAAEKLLTEMLSKRESSWIAGSYERPRYEPAMVRLCTIARDRLHDRPRARACFDRLYREFTTSELRDDALWEEARLFREDGDNASACDRLTTLVHDFPDSRFLPCAVAACPTIKRPGAGGAPLGCHAYIAKIRLGAEETSDAEAQDTK